MPVWFTKSFEVQKLKEKYNIDTKLKPGFLEAHFNGDRLKDVAVQVIDKKTKKKGILVINGGQRKYFMLGAGYKFTNEDFNDTNWLNGWELYKKHIAYQTLFSNDGDISGSKKVKLQHTAINAYSLEEGEPSAGILIYWDGKKYTSIHQGE